MNKSVKIVIAISLILLVSIGAFLLLQKEGKAPAASEADANSTASSENKVGQDEGDPALVAEGRYTNYSETELANSSYNQTIVFFYAPWCPECRAFKTTINEGQIPNRVQILETDFDSSTNLKKKYGVTLQSTFVRVDGSGNLQKKWVGYGKDKSLATILENLK